MAGQNAPGIFVTQAGIDARYAADYQYVFNSNWPSLQIAYDNLATVPASGSLTLNHALGFYPLVMGWIVEGGINYGRVFASSENFEFGIDYSTYPQTAITMAWDTNNIYLTNNDTSAHTIDVKAYNLDISKSVDYTLPKFPVYKTKYDATYGIKVSKFSKSIGSTDLRDFILHSRAQSPAVLAIVTGTSSPNSTTSSGALTYENPGNYVPWTMAFYTDSNGYYQGLAPGNQQTGTVFQLGQGLALLSSSANNISLSLVALRDPLVVSKTVSITYG